MFSVCSNDSIVAYGVYIHRKIKRSCSEVSFSSMQQSSREAVALALACGVSTPHHCLNYRYDDTISYCDYVCLCVSIVSKAIMNAHGGDLWVTSSGIPGEGCVFGMDLQVAYVDAPDEEAMPSSNPIDSTDADVVTTSTFRADSSSYYDMLHVLVVDDSPMNRKMLMLHLKGFGIENISQACDGFEAVQAVEKRMSGESDDKLFDIIFMDCLMPVMGGNEATRRIREMGYVGAIVSVTGNGLPEDVREIMSCGTDRVLVKPVNVDTVKTAISGE